MEQRILVFVVCLAIVCSGCAMEPMVSSTTTSAPTAVESDSSEPAAELPPAHGPLGQRHRAMQLVREAFRTVEPLRKAERLTLAETRLIVRNTRLSAVLVSGCDLEVLKILVASDWTPVVVTRSPVGPKHVRAIVGYDDAAGQVILADPVNYAEARVKYPEFSKQWDDPRKPCLLVLPRQGGVVDRVRSALRIYLSEEKVESIIIKTS